MKITAKQQIKEKMQELKEIISPYVGGKFPLQIEYFRNDSKVRLNLDRRWGVNPCDELIQKLYHLLGEEAVIVHY